MRVWVLGSGSAGNAVLVESGDTRILIDAGFPVRELAARLAAIGVSGESIESAIVTHEHTDHVRGVCAAAKRWKWSVYASSGTIAGYPLLREACARPFSAGDALELGDLRLQTVRTPHDGTEPVAMLATARSSGVRAGIVYDLGHVPPSYRATFERLDILVLESNHDEAMLRAGPYPPVVQARIAGAYGHLSNRRSGMFARDCVHAGLAQLVLAHLSERCNQPALALDSMREALATSRFRGALHAASQRAVCGPFTAGRAAASAGRQLSLEL
ncbi:MAG TPA: MBL fold metallo-hydrolase [Gemmatimonadaceae bacterium]|nr:MBL fold metallo-hydrolase [Gemmatimonadaceae bacterium]